MSNGRSGSRAPKSRCALPLALSVLALAAAMLGWSSADADAATPFSYGLPAHVSAPRWARAKAVHFSPVRTSTAPRSSLAAPSTAAGPAAPLGKDEPEEPQGPGQNSNQGDDGDLGRRCGGCLGVPLRYYGGHVQHEPEVHVIFWGSNWNGGSGPLLHQELMRFYEGLSNSASGLAFQGILTQYFDESGRVSSTLAPQRLSSFTDESVPAPAGVSDEALRAEARAVAENPKNRWTLGPNAQFVVIPAPGSTYDADFDQNFCAYHSVVSEPGNYWTYTFLSYNGEEPFEAGCLNYDGDATASHAEKAARVLSMDASHEYAESATDPSFSAWLDDEGNEIADICSSGDDQLANQAWVQGLWDDHESACTLQDSSPPHVLGLTETPSEVSGHEATLNATINAENEGLQTKYRFEYGTTGSYGKSAPAEGYIGVGNQLGNQQVHQTVSSVQAETTYHYRVSATIDREGREETTYGEDHTFVPSQWFTGRIQLAAGGNQGSFGSALISCSFVPWSCGGASCPSRTSCVAVGSYEAYGVEPPMAAIWSDGQWSFEALPVPAGSGSQVALTGVSCASVSACMTVGYERNTAGVRVPVYGRLNGTAGWSVASMPPPGAAGEAGLEGVSCASSTECMAVGLSLNGAGAEVPYAALWSKGGWRVQALNPPTAANAILESVSCASVKSCVAVGFSENNVGLKAALIETWNGVAWSISPAQAPPETGSFVLSGVSCASPSACMAVGTYTAAKGYAGLTERWDGANWSVQAAADTGVQEEFIGVSCPAAEECTAVGDYEPAGRWVAMVQAWNGVSWSAQASNVDQAQASELHAVSCITASTCAAVGITGWSAAARSRSGLVQPLVEIRSAPPFVTAASPPAPSPPGAAPGSPPVTGLARTALPAGGVLESRAAQLRCKVPRLRGASLKLARLRLSRAHCALGRVARPRRLTGKLVVRTQGHSPGARLAVNTRINLALGRAPRASARRG